MSDRDSIEDFEIVNIERNNSPSTEFEFVNNKGETIPYQNPSPLSPPTPPLLEHIIDIKTNIDSENVDIELKIYKSFDNLIISFVVLRPG